MKRFAATLMVTGLALFASAGTASAQTGYNTDNPTATVSNSSPAAGASFSASVADCGEASATFLFEGNSQTVNTDDDGAASATFTAPSTAGTYTGTVTCGTDVASFSVAVAAVTTTTAAPVGGLPATGSSGSSTTVIIASILLLAGLGMFGVAQLRRRQLVA